MSKIGSIILIEDDKDDEEIFSAALNELGVKNTLICFPDAIQAFDYLKQMTGQPFLIFCDVNLPMLSGLEFKKQIDNDPGLRQKSIPFLFYSTTSDKKIVTKAYTEMTIQGFFCKEPNYSTIVSRLKSIIDYWMCCEHPSNYE